MKTVNTNSVLGVMNLFNNEGYYKYAVEVMWTLRSMALKIIERKSNNGFYWDTKHPDFWISEITNDFIGRSMIDGYCYTTIGRPHWYISESREGKPTFLTYDEAEFIAGIASDSKLMNELHRLRDYAISYVNNANNPAYNIYKVTNDLLKALEGRISLSA